MVTNVWLFIPQHTCIYLEIRHSWLFKIFHRSSLPEGFYKKGVQIFHNSQEIPRLESFFNKDTVWRLATILKKTLAHVFSGEYCKFFKNTYKQLFVCN